MRIYIVFGLLIMFVMTIVTCEESRNINLNSQRNRDWLSHFIYNNHQNPMYSNLDNDEDDINVNINVNKYFHLLPHTKKEVESDALRSHSSNRQDESCTDDSDCCEGWADISCICRNKRCKISSGCGTCHCGFACFFKACNSCNNAEDCEENSACIFKYGKCIPSNTGPSYCCRDKDCYRLGPSWRKCRNYKCERVAIPDQGRPFIVQGRSRTTSSQTCSSTNLKKVESWKMGEAPLVQSSNPYNQEIGRYWLKQAEAEHASVASFARHTLQLMSIGAPSRLLVASQKAAVDEIKHAKMCYGFASAFIGSDLGPSSLDVNGSLENMNLKDIIRSLIIEGCIGETLSAIEAHLAAHNAQDTAVKTAVSEIASDETKHAQLAWDTIKWIIEKYPDSRTFADDIFHVDLQQRKTPAINESTVLPATLCEDSEKATSFRRYGHLVSGDRDKVSEAGIRDIIEPMYRAGFKAVNIISKQIIELDMATLAHEAGFQDIIELAYRAEVDDVDMISKQITDLDAITL